MGRLGDPLVIGATGKLPRVVGRSEYHQGCAGHTEHSAKDIIQRPANGPTTSGFGRRFHPILGWHRMHTGIDIGAGYGAPVVAAASGEVIFAGKRGGYGNCIIIDHGNGLTTLYGHLSIIRIKSLRVEAGQRIGDVGSTGLSTGPHLHFEVRRNGVPIDPRSFLGKTIAVSAPSSPGNTFIEGAGNWLHGAIDSARRTLGGFFGQENHEEDPGCWDNLANDMTDEEMRDFGNLDTELGGGIKEETFTDEKRRGRAAASSGGHNLHDRLRDYAPNRRAGYRLRKKLNPLDPLLGTVDLGGDLEEVA